MQNKSVQNPGCALGYRQWQIKGWRIGHKGNLHHQGTANKVKICFAVLAVKPPAWSGGKPPALGNFSIKITHFYAYFGQNS